MLRRTTTNAREEKRSEPCNDVPSIARRELVRRKMQMSARVFPPCHPYTSFPLHFLADALRFIIRIIFAGIVVSRKI